jgi:hypothetical protein
MSEIRFLFRYRDLVAATIDEHRRVISERGWCWWGWWKRPSEDSRSDIWDDLERHTGSGQTVEVGLFDSGSGLVYRALVTNVIKPAGSRGAENTIKLSAQEADHVPSYYRESPFSRAWMKITRLIRIPSSFSVATRSRKRQSYQTMHSRRFVASQTKKSQMPKNSEEWIQLSGEYGLLWPLIRLSKSC